MALSYYTITKSQEELGESLRPYQNPTGNNDDKSVTMEELAEKAKEFRFIPYHRPNGTPDLIKKFLYYDIPVMTRTMLEENSDIGHYRLVKGYDDATGEFIQDDSLQGHNLRYSYGLFTSLWHKFNYEYLILVPSDKEPIIKNLLGEDADLRVSWQKAVHQMEKELLVTPDDMYDHFNLSVALFHTGDYGKSISEFEKVETILPFRMLWYQIEPILAYVAVGNYEKVFRMTDAIFTNNNRAYAELYILRGDIYKTQGKSEEAKSEFEKAVYYNKNLKSATTALKSLQ